MPFDLPPPDPSIEFSIASLGYSKGVAQTGGVQVVVRPEVAFGSFRIGSYAKNVTSPDLDGEVGALVGYKESFGNTELSGSAAFKHATNGRPGIDKAALELVGAVTQTIGKFKPRISLTYSPNDLGGTVQTAYWEAGGSYQIDKKTSASGAIGVRRRNGGPDYTSFNAGVSRTLVGPLTAEVRYYDTSKNSLGEYYRERFVAALRARF
jgi:uncharacterized protein (TIGR02001 family)